MSTTRRPRERKRVKLPKITAREHRFLFGPLDRKPVIQIRNPKKKRARIAEIELRPEMAFSPPDRPLPANFVRIGGIPVKKTKDGPVFPGRKDIRDYIHPRRWLVEDWRRWDELIPHLLNPCLFVPQKTTRVEIPVAGPTRLCRTAHDCAHVFTVSESGQGNVVNVITEAVEDSFTVPPDPAASHPVATPLINPFTKGGINHKYKRLYVPASFHSTSRTGSTGGFYVAVVDVDATSATYLQTIDYIACDWVPEEIAFTDDDEIGVIANYMQGTATIITASSGAVLAAQVNGFPGASGIAAGGPWARSVRCANVPGVGNRAFLTLTNDGASIPGVAIIDLDDPAFPRTNFTNAAFGFIDGVGVTPDKRRILLVDWDAKLHVVRVDATPPVLERTVTMPSAGGQTYYGGIAVRPSGDMAFVATGSKDLLGAGQGTTLVQALYMTGAAPEFPSALPEQTWGLEIRSFGNPLKPHIIVCSLSGKLTIIPC